MRKRGSLPSAAETGVCARGEVGHAAEGESWDFEMGVSSTATSERSTHDTTEMIVNPIQAMDDMLCLRCRLWACTQRSILVW